MTQTVHIGIVSYAHLHAPRYAASIAAHPHARLVGIAGTGTNDEVARDEARRYNVPYFDNYEDLLAQPGLDAVYVATEPVRHREVVAQAAARGVHVLCDKPIATTLEDADAIVELARAAGIKLMVPFNPRFQLPLIKVKEALDSGAAGELVAIYAVKYGRLPTRAPGPQRADWFLDPVQAGGGGFLDIGIHAIDALRWLAGGEAKRVYAHIGTLIHTGLPGDDLGTMTVEFENGVVAALSAGWANPDGYPAWLDVRFEILTAKRAFLIDSPYHGFTVYSSQRAERRYWWRRDVDGLVDDFVQAIRQDREPAITGEDGRAALAIALAAYESARQGQVVELG
jgi:predicted dehydrogenase